MPAAEQESPEQEQHQETKQEEQGSTPDGSSGADPIQDAAQRAAEAAGPESGESRRKPTKLDDLDPDTRGFVEALVTSERSKAIAEYRKKYGEPRQQQGGEQDDHSQLGEKAFDPAEIDARIQRAIARERALQDEQRRIAAAIREVFQQDNLDDTAQERMSKFLREQEKLGDEKEYDYRMLRTKAGVRLVLQAAGCYESISELSGNALGDEAPSPTLKQQRERLAERERAAEAKLPVQERIRRAVARKGVEIYGPRSG